MKILSTLDIEEIEFEQNNNSANIISGNLVNNSSNWLTYLDWDNTKCFKGSYNFSTTQPTKDDYFKSTAYYTSNVSKISNFYSSDFSNYYGNTNEVVVNSANWYAWKKYDKTIPQEVLNSWLWFTLDDTVICKIIFHQVNWTFPKEVIWNWFGTTNGEIYLLSWTFSNGTKYRPNWQHPWLTSPVSIDEDWNYYIEYAFKVPSWYRSPGPYACPHSITKTKYAFAYEGQKVIYTWKSLANITNIAQYEYNIEDILYILWYMTYSNNKKDDFVLKYPITVKYKNNQTISYQEWVRRGNMNFSWVQDIIFPYDFVQNDLLPPDLIITKEMLEWKNWDFILEWCYSWSTIHSSKLWEYVNYRNGRQYETIKYSYNWYWVNSTKNNVNEFVVFEPSDKTIFLEKRINISSEYIAWPWG